MSEAKQSDSTDLLGPGSERAKFRTEWAIKLRTWANETRQAGRVFAMVDPSECNLIAAHLEECGQEIQRLNTLRRELQAERAQLLERLAQSGVQERRAVAEERERCAKVCEGFGGNGPNFIDDDWAAMCAAAIRGPNAI